MPLFPSGQVIRYSQSAEDAFALEYPCILYRYSFAGVSGTSEYLLPSYIFDVRKVLYRGEILVPMSHRKFRDLPAAFTGRPREYIYNNLTANTIKLYPAPVENLSALTTGLFGESVANGIVVEFNRIPDYASYRIPTFLRRRLLKCYVNKMCYAAEGKGQDLKAAAYWGKKWDALKQMYGESLEELVNENRRLIFGMNEVGRIHMTPHLPDTFGIGVNIGE